MAKTSLHAYKAKDTWFVADWLKSKGLHKLCSVFEGIQKPFILSLACNVSVKSKLQHPPPPGHTPGIWHLFLPGRREFSRGRAFDHYSLGVGNLIASLDFMLRVALIPRGVINHGEDKPSCIQSERYPIRGRLAGKQRLAQALFCIWRYSRTISIIFGM